MTNHSAHWQGVAGYMHASGGCGYDWSQDADVVPAAVLSGTLSNSPLTDPAWRSLLAFQVILLAAPSVGGLARWSIGAHPLAGCMLLGFLVSAPFVSMLPMTLALEHLRPLATICRAFVAVETAVHVAPLRELARHRLSSAVWGLVQTSVCFAMAVCVVPWLMWRWTDLAAMATSTDAAAAQALPVMVGGYALAVASAVGIVATTAEPTCSAQIFHEAGAAGVFTSNSLRTTSAVFLGSACFLFVGGPLVANAHHGAVFASLSSLASVVLTLLVAAVLSVLFLCTANVALGRRLQKIAAPPVCGRLGAACSALVRTHANELARILKGLAVLGLAVACFYLAAWLDRIDGRGDTPSDALHSCFSHDGACLLGNASAAAAGGFCAVDYKAPSPEAQNETLVPHLLPFLSLGFQPWIACFLGSLFVCNEPFANKPGSRAQWQLLLQPWAGQAHLVLGILSGMWLPYAGAFGVPGAVAATIFVLRASLVAVSSTAVALALRLPWKT